MGIAECLNDGEEQKTIISTTKFILTAFITFSYCIAYFVLYCILCYIFILYLLCIFILYLCFLASGFCQLTMSSFMEAFDSFQEAVECLKVNKVTGIADCRRTKNLITAIDDLVSKTSFAIIIHKYVE